MTTEKVGIITQSHKEHNYGRLFQACALTELFGNAVSNINPSANGAANLRQS